MRSSPARNNGPLSSVSVSCTWLSTTFTCAALVGDARGSHSQRRADVPTRRSWPRPNRGCERRRPAAAATRRAAPGSVRVRPVAGIGAFAHHALHRQHHLLDLDARSGHDSHMHHRRRPAVASHLHVGMEVTLGLQQLAHLRRRGGDQSQPLGLVGCLGSGERGQACQIEVALQQRAQLRWCVDHQAFGLGRRPGGSPPGRCSYASGSPWSCCGGSIRPAPAARSPTAPATARAARARARARARVTCSAGASPIPAPAASAGTCVGASAAGRSRCSGGIAIRPAARG